MYELIIEPGRSARQYWRDLWRYRELLSILAWRDISVRYRQTVVGVAWALLQPLLTMLVMTAIFGKVAKLPSDGAAPYSIMVLAGLLPWLFFSTAIAMGSQSLVVNAPLISKVYFPRLIIPASSVIACFADFLVSFAILMGMMLWFGFWPDWRILLLPVFVGLTFLAAMGPCVWIAALNVKYRDFRYVVPFFVQFGLYVSPVGYSSTVIRERFGDAVFTLYSLNPMVGIIDGFRWCILRGETTLYWPGFIVSMALVFLLLVAGIWHFRNAEASFADVI